MRMILNIIMIILALIFTLFSFEWNHKDNKILCYFEKLFHQYRTLLRIMFIICLICLHFQVFNYMDQVNILSKNVLVSDNDNTLLDTDNKNCPFFHNE